MNSQMIINPNSDLDVKSQILKCPDSNLNLLAELFDRLNNDEASIKTLLEIFNEDSISTSKRFQVIITINKRLKMSQLHNIDFVEEMINFLVKYSLRIPDNQMPFLRQNFSSIIILFILHTNHQDFYKTISNSLMIAKSEFSHMQWLILSYCFLEILTDSQRILKVGIDKRQKLEEYYIETCNDFVSKTIDLLSKSNDQAIVLIILRFIVSLMDLKSFKFNHIKHFNLLNPILNILKMKWTDETIYFKIRYILKITGSLSTTVSIFNNIKDTFNTLIELKNINQDQNIRDHIAIGLMSFSCYIGKFICNQIFLYTDREIIGQFFELISYYLNTTNCEVYTEYLYFCEELSNHHVENNKLECFCNKFLLSTLENLIKIISYDFNDQNNTNFKKDKLRKLTKDIFPFISSIVTPRLILESTIAKLSDPFISQDKIETYLFMLSCLHCNKDIDTSNIFYEILSGILSNYHIDNENAKLSTKIKTTYIHYISTCVPVLDRENFKYLPCTLELIQSSLSLSVNLDEATKLLKLLCQVYPEKMSEFLGTLKEIFDAFVDKQFEPSKNILGAIASLLTQCDSTTVQNAIIYLSQSLIANFHKTSFIQEKEKFNDLLAIFLKRIQFMKICEKFPDISFNLVKTIIIPHLGCLSSYTNQTENFYDIFVDIAKCGIRVLPTKADKIFINAIIESLYSAFQSTNFSGFVYLLSVTMEHLEMEEQSREVALQILQKVFNNAQHMNMENLTPIFVDDIFISAKKFYCTYPDAFIQSDLHIIMIKFLFNAMNNFFEVNVIESCLSFLKSLYNLKGVGSNIKQESNFYSLMHALRIYYGEILQCLFANIIQSFIDCTTNNFASLLVSMETFDSSLFIDEIKKQLSKIYCLNDGRKVTLQHDMDNLMVTLNFTSKGLLTHQSSCDFVYKISCSARIV